MAVTTEIYGSRMLRWALAQGGGDITAPLSTDEWMASERVPFEVADAVVSHLQAGRFVEAMVTQANGHSPILRFTPHGLQEARHQEREVQDLSARIVFAEDALLRWVFNSDQPNRPKDLQDFLSSPNSFFHGDQLSVDEILAAQRYLVQRELCGGTIDGIYLKADGRDCVLSGKTVRQYMDQRNGVSWTINNTNSPGSVIGAQEHVQQTNHFNGVDLADVATLVERLRTLTPDLDLTPEEAEQYDEDVETMATATDNPGLWRRAWLGVRQFLVRAGTGVADDQLLELGNRAAGILLP